jgi:hypothetical protein
MYGQVRSIELYELNQPRTGIPTINDELRCPNCGWHGGEDELIVTGFDTDFVEQMCSGECTLECPDCRTDAGHMLQEWHRGKSDVYNTGNCTEIKSATVALAISLERLYQVTPRPAVQQLHCSSQVRRKLIDRRRVALTPRYNWKPETVGYKPLPVQYALNG